MKILSNVIQFLIFGLMAFSATGKMIMTAQVVDGFHKFGIPANLIRPIGIMEIIAVIVYVVPTRVQFLGAILMTGYLGGAIMTHLRVGEAPLMQEFLAILVWVGYFLKHPEIARSIYSGNAKNGS
jgi:hypothetical protein